MDIEVCPRCGEFYDKLVETTGWCYSCTRSQGQGGPPKECDGCGRMFKPDYARRKTCSWCREKRTKDQLGKLPPRYQNKYPGVTLDQRALGREKPWRAMLHIKGDKSRWVGMFASEQEAVDAIREARKEYDARTSGSDNVTARVSSLVGTVDEAQGEPVDHGATARRNGR